MNTGLEYEEVVKKILSNKEQLPPISTDLRVDYVVFHDVVTRLSTIFNVRDGAQNLKYWLSREPGKPLVQFAATKQGLAALKRPSGDIAFVDY